MSKQTKHAEREVKGLERGRGRHPRKYRLWLMLQLVAAAIFAIFLLAAVWQIMQNVSQMERRGSVALAEPRPQPPMPELPQVLTPPPVKARPPITPPAPAFFDVIHPENEAAEKTAALHVLADFCTTPTWQEKLRCVREPERVRPLMQSFYETHHHSGPELDGKPDGVFVRGVGAQVLHVVFEDKANGALCYAELVRQPHGAYLLDWESFVGMGAMDWEEFKQARPAQPQLMRVILTAGNYYNYEFTDEQRYLSLRLLSQEEELPLHAFCKRESAVGRKMIALLQAPRAGANRATVRVAFPEQAQSDHCVRLLELVADRWLLLE